MFFLEIDIDCTRVASQICRVSTRGLPGRSSLLSPTAKLPSNNYYLQKLYDTKIKAII